MTGSAHNPATFIKPGLALGLVLAALIIWRFFAGQDASLNLSVDEAQYFLWSLEPAWGYFSKPPLIAWAIALSTGLCGDSEACVRLPAMLLFPATAWVIFLVVTRLFDDRTGMWAGIAFATTLLSNFYARFMTTDSLLLFCWSLALLFFLRAIDHDRWRDWLALGIAIGFGLLAKYAMAIFLLCALAALWVDHRPRLRSAKPLAAALIGLAFLIPNVLWNADHQFATVRHTAELAQLDRSLFHPMSLLFFVLAQFGIMGPLLLPAFIKAASDRATWRSDPCQRLMVLFSAPILAGFIVLSFLSRAHANWASTTYVAATMLAVIMLVRHNRMRWLAWAIAFNVMIAAGLYYWHRIVPAFGYSLVNQNDPFSALRGWDVAGNQLADQLRTTGCRAVISGERGKLVELTYYARRSLGEPVTPLAYSPTSHPRNHFDLTANIADRKFDCAILVGEFSDDSLKLEFGEVENQPSLELPEKGERQTLKTWRVKNFLGYTPRR